MNKSKICLFAFRPESYRHMEAYLNGMLAEGWRLRWCRGILAGFEPAIEEEEGLRYVVDPEAATSLIYLRRHPKNRMNWQMQQGWYSVAHSKGCQILATTDPDLESPVSPQDQAPLIKNTCRLASMIWVLLLVAAGMWISTQKAAVYSLLLTNLYLVLAALAACLVGYHAVNAILLTVAKDPANPRICKRYLFHTGMLLFMILAGTVLEMGGRNDMLMYLLLPILVIILGSIALKILSHHVHARKLFPAVALMGVALFGLIIFSNIRLSASSTQWTAQRQEELLAHADRLPVLHLSDFGAAGEPENAVQTNRSILGDNLLYAEESDFGYVFTNYTVTRSPFLSEQIFRYLYEQAQVDFAGTFVQQTAGGLTYYALEEANTYLFQQGSTVCLTTFPVEADPAEMLPLLLSREST